MSHTQIRQRCSLLAPCVCGRGKGATADAGRQGEKHPRRKTSPSATTAQIRFVSLCMPACMGLRKRRADTTRPAVRSVSALVGHGDAHRCGPRHTEGRSFPFSIGKIGICLCICMPVHDSARPIHRPCALLASIWPSGKLGISTCWSLLPARRFGCCSPD